MIQGVEQACGITYILKRGEAFLVGMRVKDIAGTAKVVKI
jgi:hypothetical protein